MNNQVTMKIGVVVTRMKSVGTRTSTRAIAGSVAIAICSATVGAALSLFANILPAQSAQTFVALRQDGNGIRALQTPLNDGFTGKLSELLPEIARRAGFNITYDPSLAVFARTVIVPAQKRTAAQALIAIASAGGLRIRVSPTEQVLIDAAPPTMHQSSYVRPVNSNDTTTVRTTALPGVTVEGARQEREAFNKTVGVSSVATSAAELRTVPAFVEPDVLRAVQVLPGVQARSDWMAGFNIRGGEGDQTLVQLDGFPVFNPFHLGGVFSAFVDGMVDRVELYTGAMPAKFGGRLSGALDLHSTEPTTEKVHGSLNVSLLSSSFTAGRTFDEGKGSWLIGARRTYLDAMLRTLGNQTFPYHFEDVSGRFTHTVAGGFRLAATGHFDNETLDAHSYDTTKVTWNSALLGVALSRPFSQTLASRFGLDSVVYVQRASVSRFNGHARFVEYDANAENSAIDVRTSAAVSGYGRNTSTTVGVELARQRFTYEAGAATDALNSVLPYDSLSQATTYRALFGSVQWAPTPSILLEAGARVEGVSTESGAGFSPRFGAKYFLSPSLAISAGGGRYTQWMHSLGRDEEPAQPIQFWVLSDSVRGVSTATDAAVGFDKWLSVRRLIHAGTFYKKYERLLTPNRYSNPYSPNDAFEDASGSSYGVDILLRQLDGGTVSGWVAYTYTMNSRTDVFGRSYTPSQDRRHNLNVVGSWRRGPYTLGGRVSVASGFPVTPQIGAYRRSIYDPISQKWTTDEWINNQSIRGDRNSVRLPTYRRLDGSVSRAGTIRGAKTTTYFSVMNVLNFRNTAGYRYEFSNGDPKRSQFPNFPILPTMGVTIAF